MVHDAIQREDGRRAFGLAPAGYHAARPDYPSWVFDTLGARCGLRPGVSVLEIGAGTGKATRPLLDARPGRLVAVEPDVRLARFLAAELCDPVVRIVEAEFETADLEPASFDLIVCATAFHWLDEATALARVAGLLRPGGWWAALWNVFGDNVRPDPFHDATQELLRGLEPLSGGPGRVEYGLDAATRLDAIRRCGAFDCVEHFMEPWSLVLDTDETAALYATFSNVALRADREAVLADLVRIARDKFGGRVVRNMTTSLYIARRAPEEDPE